MEGGDCHGAPISYANNKGTHVSTDFGSLAALQEYSICHSLVFVPQAYIVPIATESVTCIPCQILPSCPHNYSMSTEYDVPP